MTDTKLWNVFSRFIRLRDSDKDGNCKCITCGIVRHWTKMDCGHGIPRQHKSTKFSELNNHAQCKRCNGFEGGKREVYKIEVDKMYGAGTWDKLELASRMTFKRTQFDIDTMTEYYKKELQKLNNLK